MAKHHWWWLHNWVFNEIYPLANFSGASHSQSFTTTTLWTAVGG